MPAIEAMPRAAMRGNTERSAWSQPLPTVRRRGTVDGMFHTVLIGVDGRPGGQDAIALARALAPEADLVLGHVFPFAPTASLVMAIDYGNALLAESRALLREARAGAGLTDTRLEALSGSSPAKALHGLAERESVDLLLVGSAHHGPLGRALLGDVGRAALHGSPCPVAVAPRGFSGGPPRRSAWRSTDRPNRGPPWTSPPASPRRTARIWRRRPSTRAVGRRLGHRRR